MIYFTETFSIIQNPLPIQPKQDFRLINAPLEKRSIDTALRARLKIIPKDFFI